MIQCLIIVGYYLGDPVELRDYILFANGVTGEIVVNSKQKNRIEMDVDSEYITGARLYFDMKKSWRKSRISLFQMRM